MRERSEDVGSAGAGGRAGVRIEASSNTGSGDDTGLRDDVDHARATHYLLLAQLLARAPGAALLRDLAGLKGDATPLGLAQLALADAARGAEATAIATEYLNLFIGVGRGELLPYASFYRTGFLHERPLAEVRQDMAKLGLERQDSVFEPEDHISSLFEIMAGLAGGSFAAPPKAADKFFERHIAPWAPRLMADLAASPSSQFYKHVARLGAVWIEIEQEALALPD